MSSPRRTVRTKTLTSDAAVDVVIIGGGISGALSALTLSAAGESVAVVDRRQPGSGSTLASTAMIQFEIDTPLTELAAKIGRRKAERAYRRSFEAVADLGALIRDHGLHANWQERSALYLAGNAMGHRALQAETVARRRIGLPSTYLDGKEVAARFGIDTTGAIFSDGAAELDPAQTSASCLRAAQANGATVYAPCEIVDVQTVGRSIEARTANGLKIVCRRLVFATGYEVVSGIPRSAFDIVSSWAIATKPLPADTLWEGRCLIWEAADPYLYLRTTADHRILAGGEDSGLIDPARRSAAIPQKSQKLIGKLRRLLGKPELTVDYAWAGAFADSPTGLPIIRPHPAIRGAFVILGCGGNGITFSVIAANMARRWVSGRRDADAELFDGNLNLNKT
ncbi:MAG: NAD(P)/FAD-dependent oxidoreductase [Hyphomicrobium sp.]